MKFQKSHPWLTFRLSIPLDNFRMWLKLGEISSKVEHLAGAPLRPDVAKELHQVFLTKGVMATTAIEGNTLNEDQVRQIVDGKLKLPPSQRYLQTEIENILAVCNREGSALLGPEKQKHPGLCVDLIKGYNRDILKNLELGEDVVPGEFRYHSVLVGNVYRGAPPEDCPYLMDKLCDWLNGADFTSPDLELSTSFALIKAIMAHLYLAWIHPFGDGNGRTARLVEFHILMANGIPLPAAHLLSDHYNRTRAQYYRELAKASQSGGDVIPFIEYALQGFLDGIRDQIQRVRDQQLAVAWENYVHDRFRQTKASKTHKRRRDLVLELTGKDWIEVSELPMLTPKLAHEYATAGDRMVQRDLNAIHKLGLVSRKHGKVKANQEIIQAFLPGRVPV